MNSESHLKFSFGRRSAKTSLLVLMASLFTQTLLSSNYSMTWFSLDGGGGASTGGVYSVSGTVVQHDSSNSMAGGNFSLTSGSWNLLAVVNLPDSPPLTISLTVTNTAVVSWPYPSTGFRLQQNSDLNSTNWVNTPETVCDNGLVKFIVVNPISGVRFYRLLYQ